MAGKLLVIDDEREICEFVSDVADELGFEAAMSTDDSGFRKLLEAFRPTVILLDLMMPKTDGVELLRSLAAQHCGAHIILASGADERTLGTARRIGESLGLRMTEVLHKPITVPALRAIFEKILAAEHWVSEPELRAAIDSGELVLHYQPKATLRGNGQWTITGCEALVRWMHPKYGLLTPPEFLPLAQRTGLIAPLTNLVVETAIAQAGRWHRHGLPLSLAVAMNLAVETLGDLGLPDRICRIAGDNGVEPSMLIFEVTESAAMADVVATMQILTRMRLKGFGLSIDDFGTGYSSLIQLHRMPFSEMKVDRSFVGEIGESREAETIIRSIVGLAQNMGMSQCAEGIETPEALRFLESLGCEKAQGYLIGRPMAADDFMTFVKTVAE